MHLADDIKKVENGWNAKKYIFDRAVCMKSHARAGNHQRAEEYAYEIQRLQEADEARFGVSPMSCPDGMEEWVLSPARWAALLVPGYMSSRTIYAPIGSTVEQALAEAQRRFPNADNNPEKQITAADISILNDVRLYARVAAE